MSSNKKTYYPKDVSKYEITVAGIDFKNITEQISIYQEIFFPFWTGSAIVVDTQNRIMNENIAPGDEVTVKVESNDDEASFDFILHRIGVRELIKQEQYIYELEFISKDFFKDQSTRISKSFKDKKPQEMFGEIIQEIGKKDRTSTDETKYNFIVPNVSPITACQMIATFAKTTQYGADWCVYSSEKGKYCFESMEDMFLNIGKLVLLQQNPNYRDDKGEDYEQSFDNMEQYKIVNHFDGIQNTVSGALANTEITHDIINKKINDGTKYTYSQDNIEDLKKKIFKEFNVKPEGHVSFTPLHPEISEGTQIFDKHSIWKGSRKSHMLKWDHNRMLVDIPGKPGAYKELGKAATILLPSQQDENPKEKYDKYLKWYWLIVGIKHVFTFDEYHTILELTKKRFVIPLEG
jgi:hypothetical protein